MLDQIDLELRLSKGEYHRRLDDLQARLYAMEQSLLEAKAPVAIIFEGWAGTAKVRTIGILTQRLDPRGVRVHPITPPRTYETQYPWLYRFWLKIPSYGQVAIFDRSWYRQALAERTHSADDGRIWRDRCEDMAAFERQLDADGTVLIKFWLHISRKEQRRRFTRLLSDPLTAWQVTDEDKWQHRHYDKVYAVVEDMIARTDTAGAPWQLIPATDKYYARVAVFEVILRALEARIGRPPVPIGPKQAAAPDLSQHAVPPPAIAPQPLRERGMLQRVDLSLRLGEEEYECRLKLLQTQAYMLGLEVYRQQRPVVIVFEGWDAAGKGGAIQRLTEKLDPRAYTVHAIAAPAGDDKVRHYLYRFWRRLPPRGAFGIFDRSWYGRVLVERVEGFARTDEWQRAYAEINEFERQLVEFGTIIYKFWMHLSPEEQLRRFEQRQNIPYKAWKLTAEDWRNREKWPLYEEAANEMLLRTSTPTAPWTIVESEDKRFGRVKVLQTVVSRLEAELGKVKLSS
ncbi:MAG: polyphosphate:AMP phosphotransferase [Oscillochloris sp.]|nr:polyphosphate:AMP phosphotransferase [Oscillochloris sp.]